MEYPHPGGDLAPALTAATGARIEPEVNAGCLLVAGTTYYFTGDLRCSMLASFGLKWDAALIATVTIEDTNFEPGVVSAFDATVGNGWVTEVPPAFPVSPAGGGTVTAGSLAIAGGTAGAGMAHLSDRGGRRGRVKIIVGGTGGYLAVAPHGKA